MSANTYESAVAEMLRVDGAMAAAVVDFESGMMLAGNGHGVDLEIASAGKTELVRVNHKNMDTLGLKTELEDMLITLGNQYHLIRPLVNELEGLFLLLLLDRNKSNLALARRSLKTIEQDMYKQSEIARAKK